MAQKGLVYVEIKPITKVIFRDYKSFEFGGVAYNLAPYLPPSTIVGALRSLMHDIGILKLGDDEDLEVFTPSHWRLLANLIVFAKGNGDRYYYPMPRDLLIHEKLLKKIVGTPWISKNILESMGFKNNLFKTFGGDNKIYLSLPQMIKFDGKLLPASPPSGYKFVSENLFRAYINGDLAAGREVERGDILEETDIGVKFFEPKVNLGGGSDINVKKRKNVLIHPETGKGGYYQVQYFKFNDGYKYLTILGKPCRDAKNFDQFVNKVKEGEKYYKRFGGEGGLAEFTFVKDVEEKVKEKIVKDFYTGGELQEKVVESVDKDGFGKIYLLTPTVIGLRIDELREDMKSLYTTTRLVENSFKYKNGLKIEVLAVAIYEYEVFSGYSLQHNRPKETVFVAPPGSVFYVKIVEGDGKKFVQGILDEGFPPCSYISKRFPQFFDTFYRNVLGSSLPLPIHISS